MLLCSLFSRLYAQLPLVQCSLVRIFLARNCSLAVRIYEDSVYATNSIHYLVFSLAGVVLIARPPFIFGTSGEELLEILVKEVTPEQRLIAVGYVALPWPVSFKFPNLHIV